MVGRRRELDRVWAAERRLAAPEVLDRARRNATSVHASGRQLNLSDAEVQRIRRLYSHNGFTQEQLATHLGISRNTIQKILRRGSYADVPDEAEGEDDERDDEKDDEKDDERGDAVTVNAISSLNTHPARGRLTVEELRQLIVDSVECTLCGSVRGEQCRVYRDSHGGRIGKETQPHHRRITTARRRGIL